MNLNIKYCKQCKQAYDIATNFEICPECRVKQLKEVKEHGEKKE